MDDTCELAATLAGNEPTEIITGTGIGASTADLVPLMLMRRKAKETAFIWAVALDGQPVTLETRDAQDADGQGLSTATATALTVRSLWAMPRQHAASVVVFDPVDSGWHRRPALRVS